MHPEYAPYTMNLGTQSGYDIISSNGSIKAEVSSPLLRQQAIDKLNKDCKKLADNSTGPL